MAFSGSQKTRLSLYAGIGKKQSFSAKALAEIFVNKVVDITLYIRNGAVDIGTKIYQRVSCNFSIQQVKDIEAKR